MITREMYGEWKRHEVTQMLMLTLKDNLENYVVKMLNRTSPDEYEDQFIRAYAKITDAVLGWEPEIVEIETVSEEEV